MLSVEGTLIAREYKKAALENAGLKNVGENMAVVEWLN